MEKKRPLRYIDEYRQEAFLVWYSNKKPGAVTLNNMLTEIYDEHAVIPSIPVLNNWINDQFIPKAYELDLQVSKQLDEQAIASKVAMMQRHAEVGKEMQDIGIQYLRDNGVGNARNAITAVFRGIEIERQSNVPTMFEKLDKMSDDDLLKEIKQLASNSTIEIEPAEKTIDGFTDDTTN